VTIESFNEWKIRFDKEVSLRRTREEEEKLKALTTKEREEYKRIATRLTGGRVLGCSLSRLLLRTLRFPGRQLFERDRNLAMSDASFLEEGTDSVDVSQYERTTARKDEEEDRLEFSDSD
jgi:hypothetical protein